jgi:hypothetical protein
MRTFVKFAKAGAILSVCRTEFVSPEMETPFGILQKGESAIEVADAGALEKLSLEDIHNGYKVDAAKKKLVKKR